MTPITNPNTKLENLNRNGLTTQHHQLESLTVSKPRQTDSPWEHVQSELLAFPSRENIPDKYLMCVEHMDEEDTWDMTAEHKGELQQASDL